MYEVGRLFLYRLHPLGVRVTDGVDRDTRHEIEVLLALGVVQIRSFSVFECQRDAPVVLEEVFRALLFDFFVVHDHHFVIIVPWSTDLITSETIERGSFPFTIRTFATPAFNALRHASTFGTIPPDMMPFAISSSTSFSVS